MIIIFFFFVIVKHVVWISLRFLNIRVVYFGFSRRQLIFLVVVLVFFLINLVVCIFYICCILIWILWYLRVCKNTHHVLLRMSESVKGDYLMIF
jgi:hypothetical protein